MPKCPKCQKEVYFAEKVTSLGKDWHRPCLKCEKCNKTLSSGSHAEHEGKPYCHNPCYAALFGPKDERAHRRQQQWIKVCTCQTGRCRTCWAMNLCVGFGRGGTESHTYK